MSTGHTGVDVDEYGTKHVHFSSVPQFLNWSHAEWLKESILKSYLTLTIHNLKCWCELVQIRIQLSSWRRRTVKEDRCKFTCRVERKTVGSCWRWPCLVGLYGAQLPKILHKACLLHKLICPCQTQGILISPETGLCVCFQSGSPSTRTTAPSFTAMPRLSSAVLKTVT
jgi:hypothetical protein